jgi:hypothetical protein
LILAVSRKPLVFYLIHEKEVTKMEKEEIELASDKSASDIEITVEELLDFGIDVDQVIQRRC